MTHSFVTPWTVACQAPLSMGFSRQECWSGLPFPSPGDLPGPGIEPTSPVFPCIDRRILYHQATREALHSHLEQHMCYYGFYFFQKFRTVRASFPILLCKESNYPEMTERLLAAHIGTVSFPSSLVCLWWRLRHKCVYACACV